MGRVMIKTGARLGWRGALFSCAGVAAIACQGFGAQAATTGAAPAAQVEEVIVTAQKRSENLQNVPISIQAFSAKDIQALGIKSSIDIGAVTPNVAIALVAGPGNQPIITIRGIGLNDYDTNNAGPNGVYSDEVYLSSPASQSFTTFDLDHIEVLKGPQGTLYGRNTSGGAIDFVSSKPTDDFNAKFHAEYSSFDTVNLEGAVGGPITSTLDGRAAFVYNTSRGFVHNDLTGGPENGTNNWASRIMLLWKPTSDFKLLFNVHGGQVDNRVTEYRHIGTFVPGTENSPSPTVCSISAANAGQCVDIFGYGTPSNFYEGAYNRNQHLKVNSLGAYLRGDWSPGPVTFTSITAFEHNDKLHPEDSDASPNRLLEINFGVRSNTFTQELRASYTSTKLNWVFGGYYLHEDLKQNQPIFLFLDFDKFGGFGVPAGPGNGDYIAEQAFDRSDQQTDAYAVYGQGDYALTSRLKLTLGGRYTDESRSFLYVGTYQLQMGGMDNFGPITPILPPHYGTLSNSAFNYRVALDYKLTDDILTYGSIATGYKSGDFNGSFLSLNPAELQLQLQPVKPEHVTAYELGFKTSFLDRRVIFDGAAFYNDYSNLQVFVLVPPVAGGSGLPVNVLDNAKAAHTEGLEAQFVGKPTSNFTVSTQLGYLETRLDTFVTAQQIAQQNLSGKQLPVSPHLSLAGLADYAIPLRSGKLDLQFSASYKSKQFFDITNDPYTVQTGYWIENLRIAYSNTRGRWEVAGYVRNLSDKHYYLDEFDLTSPFGFIQGIMGTPRTFGMEFNVKY